MFAKSLFKLLLIGSIFLLLPLLLNANQTNFYGEWNGNLTYANNDCNISLNISTNDNGQIDAFFDIPLQNIFDIPADKIDIDKNIIILELESKGIVYKGEIKGNTIEGTWKQQGISLNLKFEKTN